MPPKRKRSVTNSSGDARVARDEARLTDAGQENGVAYEDEVADGQSKGSPSSRRRPRSRHSDSDASNGLAAEEAISVERPPLRTVNGDDIKMEAPPRAGIVDPVGYHTNPPPEDRVVRVYADGVFDLCHLGHMRQLEQAKKAFPNTHLTVGVTGDTETHRRKGLTVLSARERAETVRHCRWVDEVLEDCPWVVTAEFLDQHKFDYVAHDDLPYGADEGDDIYGPIKERGMFLVTQRTEGVSTTGIITKIVRDYEQYISRQLKRGTSRQELNVSWLKKNELELKRHVAELRNSIRTNWSTTGQELSRELRAFWPPSRPASPANVAIHNPSPLAPSSSRRSGDYFSPSANGARGSSDGRKSPPLAMFFSNRFNNRQDATPNSREPTSPTVSANQASSDFATGYSLGLVGGIRSWMTRNRRNVRNFRGGVPAGEASFGSGSGSTSEESEEDAGDRERDAEAEDDDDLEGPARKKRRANVDEEDAIAV